MKRYTKWLAIIMAASMILTTATACGKKDTVAETYKTMAQEYMDKLDYASAIEILQKGIEETNNEELASMLETCMEWNTGGVRPFSHQWHFGIPRHNRARVP